MANHTIMEYDERGLMVRSSEYGANGKLKFQYESEYDSYRNPTLERARDYCCTFDKTVCTESIRYSEYKYFPDDCGSG